VLPLSTQLPLKSVTPMVPITPTPLVTDNLSGRAPKVDGIRFGISISHLPETFVPLVSTILKLTGNKLQSPIPNELVSQVLTDGTSLKPLNLSRFRRLLKHAIAAKIVETEEEGNYSFISLIGDLEKWSPAYVVRHLPPSNEIRSGPCAKVGIFIDTYFAY
jgi:hypothetical protein